jgi:hypothetical protein
MAKVVQVGLLAALCSAAFGSTITYNYTGQPFDRCNGTTTGSGNCPNDFTTDNVIASATFNAPLAGGLSVVDEKSAATTWSISDKKGVASFSSSDANAASELLSLSLSTNASGALSGWVMEASDLIQDQIGTNLIAIFNPTIIGGGTGLPFADGGNFNGGGNGGIGPPGSGYNPGNSVAGSWTETLNLFPGGTTSAPVFLLGANPIGGVTGTISSQSPLDYYYFNWGGGAFSASASISDAAPDASFLFSMGAVGTCSSLANETLSGPGFSGNISFANLGAGQYCIGLDDNSGTDPTFSLAFDTPIAPTPEPSQLMLLTASLVMLGAVRRAKRVRLPS